MSNYEFTGVERADRQTPDSETTMSRHKKALLKTLRLAHAWRDGYYTGKRDYAASIIGGQSMSTPNPYEEAALKEIELHAKKRYADVEIGRHDA